MRPLALLTIGLFMLPGGGICAAENAYKVVQRLELTKRLETRTPWTVTVSESVAFNRALAGGAIGDELNDVFDQPAHVCFVGGVQRSEHCLYTRTPVTDSKSMEPEQSLRELSVVTLAAGANPMKGVVLRTRSYADSEGENGTRVWRYAPETDSFDLVSTLSGGDVSEIRFVHNSAGASFLVAADYVWENSEGHFDPHRFRVDVYRFRPEGHYEHVLDYVTRSRYPITKGNEITAAVIMAELKTIAAKVEAAHPEWSSDPRASWTENLQ